jgi:hypothetical protein
MSEEKKSAMETVSDGWDEFVDVVLSPRKREKIFKEDD